jgi:hypothetical protein
LLLDRVWFAGVSYLYNLLDKSRSFLDRLQLPIEVVPKFRRLLLLESLSSLLEDLPKVKS